MPKWLKKLLRKWLLDPEEEDSSLDCVFLVDGKQRLCKCLVVGAAGGALRVHSYDSEVGERLVMEHDVVERKKFWRMWKRFQGSSKITWEDGSPFEMEN